LKLVSNALVTLVKTKQDCFKEMFENVNITFIKLQPDQAQEFFLGFVTIISAGQYRVS